MARGIHVAAALVLVAAALTAEFAAAANQNVDTEDSKISTIKEVHTKKIIDKQSPSLKSIHFDKDIKPVQKGLLSKSNYFGSVDLPKKESDNSIPNRENEERGAYQEIRKDLPPEVALKTATRMIEEEADRRKKFRNMMRSLVHSELPHLDPKLDYTPEESEESVSKERNTEAKLEEDMVSRSLSRFSHIFPFLLSRSFPPFSPLQPSMFPLSDSAIESEVTDNRKSSDQLSFLEGNNKQDSSSNRKDPVMLFIPRRSLRIDMTFIPIQREPIKENTQKSDPLPPKSDSNNRDEKPHSIRVFSSDSSSPFPNVGSFPFSRLLNFFRNVGEGIDSSAPQSKVETITTSPESHTTRRKREIPTTEEPAAATVASRSAPEEPPAAAPNAAPPVSSSAPEDDNIKVEPRILNTEDEKEETHQKSKTSSRMLTPGMDAYGMGVMDDPARFHPHPLAAFAISEGLKFPEVKPYFHMMPYYFTGAILPDKFPIGMMGMMPGMMGSGLEQQMVAMNQLAQEANQGAAANVEAAHHQPLVGGGPCLSPCVGIPMRTFPSMARKKRSISAHVPFQQASAAARPYDAVLPQRRSPPDSSRPQDFLQVRTNMDDESFDADREPAVLQSKLLLKGEPEAIRKLNPHFKMSFGSEENERKGGSQREQVGGAEGMKKFVDKPKTSPFSVKKYYRTIPEKKKSKKMLAALGMNPPQTDPLWEVPVFGVNPFLPRMAPSLLGEMETPVAEERMPFRGKRSAPHIQFVHPSVNSEEEQNLAAVHDDLITGEGSRHDFLSGVRADGRKGSRRRSKTKPTDNGFVMPSKTKAKVIEEQVLEILKTDKNKPDFTPWLDPTMKGDDDHDDHFHRKELGNDFKLFSYDH